MAAKKTKARKQAAKKTSTKAKAATPNPAMEFIVAALKKNRHVAYADVKAAADMKKLVIFPIMYGRAKLLLGMVKAGQKKTKKTATRGPGRPKGSKNKRGPGAPRKTANRKPGRPRKAVSAMDALQGLVAGMKATERENAQLRSTLEKVAALIDRVS